MSRFIIDSTQTSTFVPSAYDRDNSVVHSTGNVNNGLKGVDSTSNWASLYLPTGASAEMWAYYNFDCSTIPQDAIINNVTCRFRGYPGSTNTNYQSNNYYQVSIGTNKLTPTTGFSNLSNIYTNTPNHEFTRSELDNIKICIHSQRHSSKNTTSTSIRVAFCGAELNVNYSLGHYEYDVNVISNTDFATVSQSENVVDEGNSITIPITITNINNIIIEDNNVDVKSQLVHQSGNIYNYTISNVNYDHDIVINRTTIDIEPEDPEYNYYTLSLSCINGETTPDGGAYRYVEGSNQTIEIVPNDTIITIARDNGVDISSQLQQGRQIYSCEYTSATVSGATYSFTQNSDGWFTNQNTSTSQRNTYAMIRINLNLEVECLVTIKYYGDLQGAADTFSVGNIDENVAVDNSTNGSKIYTSSPRNTIDNPNTASFTNVQGEHFIILKLRRSNQANSSSVTHTINFKIEITPLVPTHTWIYNLSNIQDNHSLMFVFGDVEYYTINTTTDVTNAKFLPYGNWVSLPNETYKLVIIPDNITQKFQITDNDVDVTNYMEYHEFTDENNQLSVNYVYKIFNVNANHNLVVSNQANQSSKYIKINGSWNLINNIYVKQNGEWILNNDYDITSINKILFFNS